MKFKRIVAVVLIISMLFAINTTSFASETLVTDNEVHISSFIDGDGKVNTVHVSSERPGTAHVEYYIDNVLVSIVDTEILNSNKSLDLTVNETNNVRINRTDVATGENKVYIEPLSKYITSSQQLSTEASVIESPEIRGYTYQGRINYNTFVDEYGYVHNDKIYIYQEAGNTTYNYKTLRGNYNEEIETIIGAVVSYVTTILLELAGIASPLVSAIISSVGATVINGRLMDSFVKEYYVRTTPYSIKARDVGTSREMFYDAEIYQVALVGGGYSSEYYYDGYLPWNSSVVAYWIFCDFWIYTYPGVASYA